MVFPFTVSIKLKVTIPCDSEVEDTEEVEGVEKIEDSLGSRFDSVLPVGREAELWF